MSRSEQSLIGSVVLDHWFWIVDYGSSVMVSDLLNIQPIPNGKLWSDRSRWSRVLLSVGHVYDITDRCFVPQCPLPSVHLPVDVSQRSNARNLQDFESQEHDVETAHGVLHVTMRGVAKGNRPTILTYHDVGLNLIKEDEFRTCPASQNCVPLWIRFHVVLTCCVSVSRYQYPTVDELAQMLPAVLSQLHRMDLEMERPVLGLNDTTVTTLRCPTLLVVGDTSPAVDAVVECNSRLNPTKTTLLKMADCGGLPQVVQPGKLAEAFKYFVQGMGYMPTAGMTRLVRSRTHSASSVGSSDGSRSRSAAAPLAEDISPSNDHAALRTIEMSA
ncbi:hypothetical protein fugu_006767 [Takifugu bimaculatus]|uniref:Uncharacterized protein n=1 Tax=Takifugu bimaculatus TaxID=433685 RepID=A0A4Z2B326_9TELE|nr:hypothetical protein fugu_006767 [Takifugu bimaculatus]